MVLNFRHGRPAHLARKLWAAQRPPSTSPDRRSHLISRKYGMGMPVRTNPGRATVPLSHCKSLGHCGRDKVDARSRSCYPCTMAGSA